ncbi:MAG: SIS domain-containing protein [Acidimicrobiales bacterium]
MSHATDEIATQPACWAAAADLAAGVARSLPAPGERVAAVGCGTSYNMAQAYACLREEAGAAFTDAIPASETVWGRRHYDRILFLSRSGTTTEVLDALDRVPRGTPTVAITADPDTPIVEAAGTAVLLDFADEASVVQTRFATSALVLLRAHLGQDVGPLVDQAKRAVDAPLPSGALDATRFTFLGHGWTVGLAHEGALKLREAAQAWTESYPGMEVRHGPISVIDGNSLVWCLGPAPGGLAADLSPTGTRWVQSELDPLADLVRVQRLAVELAVSRDLDPDRPRNLERSVILPGGH